MASNLQDNVMLGSFMPIDFDRSATSQEIMGGEGSMLTGDVENDLQEKITPG